MIVVAIGGENKRQEVWQEPIHRSKLFAGQCNIQSREPYRLNRSGVLRTIESNALR